MTRNKMFTSYPTFGENKILKICAITVINAISKSVKKHCKSFGLFL